MVAPVPLVKRALMVGQDFRQEHGKYVLAIEPAAAWEFWREQAPVIHVMTGERLYGVSAVFAPAGVTALLEHRWELQTLEGWRQMAAIRFQSTGGREKGFRGYSWMSAPSSGNWRLTVATQDGRIIGITSFRVEHANTILQRLAVKEL